MSWKSADELWRQRKIAEPLITLPESESAVRRFRRGLQKHSVQWATAIEASSLEAITAYVAGGGGIGLNVDLPEVVTNPKVRALPLDGFEPLEVVAMWLGEPAPAVTVFLEEARAYVRKAWPQWQCVQ